VNDVGNCAVWETYANFGNEIGKGIDAAHDTLVIALKEDGNEREDGNKREELDVDIELAGEECFQRVESSAISFILLI